MAACGSPAPPAPPAAGAPDARTQAADFGGLVENYWTDSAALMPWYAWGSADTEFGESPEENIAPQTLADSLALERRYLAELQAIQRSNLDPEAQLTYDIFLRQRLEAIDGFTYPAELLPVNPYDGMPERFASMACAAERLALSSDQDYERWQSRTESLVRWMAQAIANMREGMRRGYTLPRAAVDKTLPLLAALGADTAQNVFYQSMQSNEEGAGDAQQRARLKAAMTLQIRDRVLPSYRELHDFVQHDYLPRSRTSVGLSALPLGAAWYEHLVKRTVPGQTAAQLHALGMTEMEHGQQRVQALLGEAAFSGNAQAFYERMRSDPRNSYKNAAELVTAYQELRVQASAGAPALFPIAPRAEFAIRGVEAYRESVAPQLAYSPRAPNGLVAATLYVDTAGLDASPATPMAAQFLREAIPGHHYQMELQRERTDLPRVRRFGGATAFIEGWGLYAASLGEELGVYHDAEAKFGLFLSQLNCAAAVVIDTGLHAQGWTRQQALEYVRAQVPSDEAAASDAVDRAIARPGAGLACTVGYLKMMSLRAQAQQALGSRFDMGAFHAEVLRDGAMPLDILDAKIKRWIQAGGPAPPGIAAPAVGPASGVDSSNSARRR